jgi:hypothetical protein
MLVLLLDFDLLTSTIGLSRQKEGNKEVGGTKKNPTRQLMSLQVEDPQYTNNQYKEPTQTRS